MENQVDFMRNLIARGVVDEWHLWDFTRKDSDRDWLWRSFGANLTLSTAGDSVVYRPLVASFAGGLSFTVQAENDAHVLLRAGDAGSVELVFGAHGNTCSLLRTFPGTTYHLHAHPQAVAQKGLVPDRDNTVTLNVAGGMLDVALNGEALFRFPVPAAAAYAVDVHTGYGAIGLWHTQREASGIRLMRNQLSSFAGFRSAYTHYCTAHYADAVFLKLDDDIVWCDAEAVAGFVAMVREDERASLVSANVINNGVCAWYQGQAGVLGDAPFAFDYPPGGLCGTLWESADLCTALHEHFIADCHAIVARCKAQGGVTAMPRADRFSINFVGFRYPMMLMMVVAYLVGGSDDDEYLMTQVVPMMFGIDKVIANALVVAHLSFNKQDPGLDIPRLLERYRGLHTGASVPA